jgi:hypothetical protein
MAFKYFIYRTDFGNTIIRTTPTNTSTGGTEASLYADFTIPEIQPVYLWRVQASNVVPNLDSNIQDWTDYTAHPPTSDELTTFGDVTGITSTKIDIVTGVSGDVPVFNVDGNIQSSGLSIAELTGLTTYTFVESGNTQISQVGNQITIFTPTGDTTATWGSINGNLSNQTDLWNTLTGMTGETATKLDTSLFNSYSGATKPILDKALTGVTNNGTGTTVGGVSARNVTFKSISAIGGVKILTGDANNLIISGETNANAVWGSITGTLSNQTDLNNALTGLTAQVNTKLNASTFSTYTGTTVPNTYYNKTQINSYTGATATLIGTKQNTITGAATTITTANLTASRALVADGSGKVAVSTVTSTELGYLGGVTSAIQTQFGLKANLASPTFTGTVVLPATTSIGTVTSTEIGYLDNVTSSIQTQLNAKAALASPALTGTPTAPTAAVNTNTTQLATTAFVVGQASATNPLMNGTVAIGTSLRYSREDHVHASDTSRLAVSAFNAYTGTSTNVLNSAVTGATNGLTKVGRNIELGGVLTKNTVISGSTFDFTVNSKSVNLQAINGVNIIDTDGVGGVNIETDGGTISLIGNTNLSVERTKFEINETQMLITDSRATKTGLEYAGDYNTTFTANSLVDKRYVDSIASGLVPKASVKVATTTSIALSGLILVDGITVANGDRVLVKNQGTASQNGIYVAAAGAWARATDFDGLPVFGEVTNGNLIPVETGSTLHNTIWVLTTLNPITVGTTALAFSLFSSSQDLLAGTGISILANTISVNGSALAGNSISWTGNTFNVNPASGTLATALGAKQATITGAATTITTADLTASRTLVSDGSGKVAVSTITSTELGRLSGVTSNIQSQINSKLATTVFNTFTGTTLPANYYNKTQINAYTGATDSKINTKLNISVFTGYTASTVTNQIQLIHTGGTDINTVVATGIEWDSVSYGGSSFTWTGGTDIKINKTATYEVSYHVPHGHTGTNNVRGIASNLVLNGVTILNNTVGASATSRAGMIANLVLPNTILSLNANDVLELIAFRTGQAGVSTTAPNGVILIKEKNKLQ